MTTYDSSTGETLSALFDGQPGSEAALANLHTSARADVHASWNAYHLIGESLRVCNASALSVANGGADPAFLQRLSVRLAGEVIQNAAPQLMSSALGMVATGPVAANDGQFRWKLVAGFASLAAVFAVTWGVMGTTPVVSAPQLAQSSASPTLVTSSSEGPMIRDPRLEELLSAHKQLGATSLQVPSGFVRNAGFQTSGR